MDALAWDVLLGAGTVFVLGAVSPGPSLIEAVGRFRTLQRTATLQQQWLLPVGRQMLPNPRY